MGFFLTPIVLAIVGATLAGETGGAQLLGGVAGLIVGMAGSLGVARFVHRIKRTLPHHPTRAPGEG